MLFDCVFWYVADGDRYGLGSEMRASIGIGSVGGIILSSLMALYFIPALYLVLGAKDKKPEPDPMVIDPK